MKNNIDQQIDSIVKKRQPTVAKIESSQENLWKID